MSSNLEVAGLPASGPATLDLAKTALNFAGDDSKDAQIQQFVDAVNAFVRLLPKAGDSAWQDDWRADFVLGSTMLVARWWRRKDNPDGIISLGDGVAAFVRKSDPDIALMLGIGARPAIG